jgi:hypothetical protein
VKKSKQKNQTKKTKPKKPNQKNQTKKTKPKKPNQKNQTKKTKTYHLEIFLVLLNDNIIYKFFLHIF